MAAFADLVRFIPTAGGLGDFAFASAVAGCQSPALANVQNGVLYKCYAISGDLTQWELFEGAYNSATLTFARTTILYNSSGTGSATGQSGAGTKINFLSVPQVAIVALAEDLISTGSWTPVLAGSGVPGSHTYSTQIGRWEMVGNSVNLWFRIILTNLDVAATGNATITGLPFISSNIGFPFQGIFGCNLISHQASYNQFTLVVGANSNIITLQEIGDNIATSNVPITNLHNTTIITGNVNYRIGP